jgi:putative redox protein
VLDDPAGNRGASPVELVALALGACTAMDVISILRKKRQTVNAYAIRVDGERSANHPRVFTELVVHHTVRGRSVNPRAVEDAIHLSHEKYCSVGAMLQKAATVHQTFEIEEEPA